MSGLTDYPTLDTLNEWEPEPLHLPIGGAPHDERRHRGYRNRIPEDGPGGRDEGGGGEPGSHVIVIDLA